MKKFYFGKKLMAALTAATLMLSILPTAFATEEDDPLTINFYDTINESIIKNGATRTDDCLDVSNATAGSIVFKTDFGGKMVDRVGITYESIGGNKISVYKSDASNTWDSASANTYSFTTENTNGAKKEVIIDLKPAHKTAYMSPAGIAFTGLAGMGKIYSIKFYDDSSLTVDFNDTIAKSIVNNGGSLTDDCLDVSNATAGSISFLTDFGGKMVDRVGITYESTGGHKISVYKSDTSNTWDSASANTYSFTTENTNGAKKEVIIDLKLAHKTAYMSPAGIAFSGLAGMGKIYSIKFYDDSSLTVDFNDTIAKSIVNNYGGLITDDCLDVSNATAGSISFLTDFGGKMVERVGITYESTGGHKISVYKSDTANAWDSSNGYSFTTENTNGAKKEAIIDLKPAHKTAYMSPAGIAFSGLAGMGKIYAITFYEQDDLDLEYEFLPENKSFDLSFDEAPVAVRLQSDFETEGTISLTVDGEDEPFASAEFDGGYGTKYIRMSDESFTGDKKINVAVTGFEADPDAEETEYVSFEFISSSALKPAFETTFGTNNYDKVENMTVSGNKFNNIGGAASIVYENVDFGETKNPVSFNINISSGAGMVADVYYISIGGETTIKHTTTTIGDWKTFEPYSYVAEKGISGIHTVVIKAPYGTAGDIGTSSFEVKDFDVDFAERSQKTTMCMTASKQATDIDATSKVYLALYDATGKLAAVDSAAVTVDGNYVSAVADVPMQTTTEYTVKAFVWGKDGIAMMPFVDAQPYTPVNTTVVTTDAYTTINAYDEVDELFMVKKSTTDKINGVATPMLGGTHTDSWVRFANVDFGDTAPTSVKINSATWASGETVTYYIDSIDEDNVIATQTMINEADESDGTYKDRTANITKEFTGVHDVYLKFSKEGAANIYTIDFLK